MRSWRLNILANIFGRASSFILSLAFTPIFVHHLGIESFSLVAFFTSLVAMTYVLDTTFGATMTRELAQTRLDPHGPDATRDLARSLEYFYVVVSAALATVCFFSAAWLATRWLNVETLPLATVRDSIAMMGICVALQAPITIYIGGLNGLERQTLLNALQASLGLVRGLGATAAIIFIAPTTVVFFGWQILFGILQLTCFALVFWNSMPTGTRRPRFSKTALRRVARFASGMAATGIVTFFLSQINTILLSKFLPLSQLGIFQIANQVNNGSRLLGSPIESAVFPRLAFHSGSDDKISLDNVYHEACQAISLLVLPASSIIIFFPSGLINAWISDTSIADQAAPVAAVLVIGSMLNNLLRVPYQVTLAKGWSMFGFYQNMLAVVGFLPLLLYLAYTFGMLGAAFAWLILNLLYFLVSAPIIHRIMVPGHFKRWLVQDVLVPLAATLTFAFALREAIPDHLPKYIFLTTIFAGWLANSAICAAVMPQMRHTLIRVAKRAFG